jgi:hypothetical protein
MVRDVLETLFQILNLIRNGISENPIHALISDALFSGRGRKRRSELALSEVEGVNPEQPPSLQAGESKG